MGHETIYWQDIFYFDGEWREIREIFKKIFKGFLPDIKARLSHYKIIVLFALMKFKIYDVTNISWNKDKQAMKFGHVIE